MKFIRAAAVAALFLSANMCASADQPEAQVEQGYQPSASGPQVVVPDPHVRVLLQQLYSAKNYYETNSDRYAKLIEQESHQAKVDSDQAQAKLSAALTELSAARNAYEQQTAALKGLNESIRAAQAENTKQLAAYGGLINSRLATVAAEQNDALAKNLAATKSQLQDQSKQVAAKLDAESQQVSAAVAADDHQRQEAQTRLAALETSTSQLEAEQTTQSQQIHAVVATDDRQHQEALTRLAAVEGSMSQMATIQTAQAQALDKQATSLSQSITDKVSEIDSKLAAGKADDEKSVAAVSAETLDQFNKVKADVNTTIAASEQKSQEASKQLLQRVAAIESVQTTGSNASEASQESQDRLLASINDQSKRIDGLQQQLVSINNTGASQHPDAGNIQDAKLLALQQKIDSITADFGKRLSEVQARTVAGAGQGAKSTTGDNPTDDAFQAQVRAVQTEQAHRIESMEQALESLRAGGSVVTPTAVAQIPELKTAAQMVNHKASKPGPVDCEALGQSDDVAWENAVEKVYPGYRLVYTDAKSSVIWLAQPGQSARGTNMSDMKKQLGCTS